MIRLSASSIKDYLTCPAMLYYRINFSGETEPNKYMLLGTILHNVIQDFPFDKASGARALKNKLDEFPIVDPKHAWKCFDNFYQNFSGLLSPEEKAECPFFIKNKDYFMVGKLDRINFQDHVVYDWKTSAKAPRSISNDIQFIIYYMSYKQLYGVYPTVFYGSLTEGSLIKYKPVQEYIDTLYKEIIPNILSSVKNNVFYKKGVFDNYSCQHCSYSKICLENKEHELVY